MLVPQQSADRHVDPFGHIILIPSQLVFALIPLCCVLSGEATNTNFIVFGLTQAGLEPTIYYTRGEHANYLHHRCGSLNFDVFVRIIKKEQTSLSRRLNNLKTEV